MTQLHPINSTGATDAASGPQRNGLFLVKPASKLHAFPGSQPRKALQSRALGLLTLAAAALAAPLLWLLHAALTAWR